MQSCILLILTALRRRQCEKKAFDWNCMKENLTEQIQHQESHFKYKNIWKRELVNEIQQLTHYLTLSLRVTFWTYTHRLWPYNLITTFFTWSRMTKHSSKSSYVFQWDSNFFQKDFFRNPLVLLGISYTAQTSGVSHAQSSKR